MTTLTKPLSRVIEVSGHDIIITIHPSDAGILAHIRLRMKGSHNSYKSFYIEPPPEKP